MLYRLCSAFVTFALVVLVGHVTDATTGQGLPGISVSLSGVKAKATTDGSGAYKFKRLRPGKYTLTVVSDDVPPQRRQVTVRRGASTVYDISACSTTLDYSCAQAEDDGPGR